MATWEDILNANPRTTATGAQRTTPAVIRRSDVMRQPQPVATSQPAWSAVGEVKTKASEPGGFKGILTDILESPVGKVIGKAGQVISIPGRVLPSAFKEIKDALDNDPNTQASFDDLGKQILDPTFGFGTVIGDLFPDDNFWGRFGNRALGFIGDVALDPLTYVTFGGSKALSISTRVAGETVEVGAEKTAREFSRVTGRSGREALAVRVLEKTGDSELAKNVYRYGRSGMADRTDEVFEQIGANRAGVYFMGRRVGMTKVGEKMESGMAGIRTWTGDHIFKRASELFTPNDVANARKALARGQVPNERAEAYLRLVVSDNIRRSAAGQAARTAQASLDNLINEVGKSDYESASSTVYRILEGEVSPVDELTGIATTTEQRVAAKISQWFDTRFGEIRQTSNAVDPAFDPMPVKNYFPHVMTDDAIRWITRTNSSNATALREVLFNPLDSAGSFKHRMTIDDKFFGVKLSQVDGPITVNKLNKIAREGGFRGDFFETDAAAVLRKYVGNYAEQMGLIARKKYLVDSGIFTKMTEKLKTDKKALKEAKTFLKEAFDGRATALASAATKAREALTAINKNALTAVGVYDAGSMLDEAMAEMLERSQSLINLYDNVPDGIRALEDEYQSLVSKLGAAQAALYAPETTLDDMQKRLIEISDEADRLNQIEAEIGQVGQFLQENIDKVMDGGSLSGKGIAVELGRAIRSASKQSIDVEGTRLAAIKRASQEQWWKDANPAGDITINQLKGMSSKDVAEIVSMATRGNAQIDEIRKAVLWVAASSPELKTQQPRLWRELFGQEGLMAKAGLDSQYAKSLTKTRDQGRRYAQVAARRSNLASGAQIVRNSIREYVASRRLMREFVAEGDVGRAMLKAGALATPMDKLAELLTKPQYEVLYSYFQKSLGLADDVGFMGIPRQLDNRDIATMLKAISSEFESGKAVRFTVGYKTTGKYGAQKTEKSFVVDMSKLTDDIDWLVENGTIEDIDNYIELILRGSVKDRISGPPRKFAEVVDEAAKPPTGKSGRSGKRGGARIVNLADRPAEDAGAGARARMASRLEGKDRLIDQRQVMAKTALLRGDAETAAIQMAKRQADFFDAKAIRETMTELIKREAADDSIFGQMRALEREIARDFPDIPVSYFGTEITAKGKTIGGVSDVGRRVSGDARQSLQESLSRMWFVADVNSRIDAVVAVMASAGLAPGLEVVQKIYNKVAKEFLSETLTETSAINRAIQGMERIIDDIDAGVFKNPAKAFAAIEELLGDSSVSRLVARHRSAVDAPRLNSRWILMGGKSGTKAFDELTERVGPRVADKMKAEYRESLRDWYQSMYPGARRNTSVTVIKEALDAAADAAPSVRRRIDGKWVKVDAFGPNATMDDLRLWLNQTVRDVRTNTSATRRRQRFLEKAADPFVDPYDRAAVGSYNWNMDLPSTLATALRRQARDMESAGRMADELASKADEARTIAIGAQEELTQLELLAETLSIPAGQRPRLPISRATREGLTEDDLVKVRNVVREIVAEKNSPEYFSAIERKELNDVIQLLAEVGKPSDGSIRIPLRRSHVSVAREWFDSGIPLFIKFKDKDVWIPVTSRGQLTDDIGVGNIAYRESKLSVTRAGENGARVADATKNVNNKKAIALFNKRLDTLDKQLAEKEITKKRYDREVQKLIEDSKKIGRQQKAGGYEDLLPVPDQLGLNNKEITRLNVEIDKLVVKKNNLLSNYGEMDYDKVGPVVAKIDDDIAGGTAKRDALRAAASKKAAGFISKDGSDLVFNQAELESLFLTAGDRASVQALVDEGAQVDGYLLKLEAERAERTIGLATKRMLQEIEMSEETRKIVMRWAQSPSAVLGDGSAGGLAKALSDAKFVDEVIVPAWQRKIDELTRYRARINVMIGANDPMTQNSALMKAHFILQEMKAGKFTSDELTDGINGVGKASEYEIKARLGHLDRVWSASEDKKILDYIDGLEQTAQASAYRSVLRDGEKARAVAARLSGKADELETRASSQFELSQQQQVQFIEKLGGLSRSVHHAGVEYDAVARYTQLTTPSRGRKTLSPVQAVEKIKQEVLEIAPMMPEGPLTATGTMLARPLGTLNIQGQLNKLADEAAYLAGELEDNIDLATGKISLGLEVGLRKQFVAELSDRVEEVGNVLDSTKKEWAKEKKAAVKAGESAVKRTAKNLQRAEQKYVDMIAKFDESKLFEMSGAEYAETALPKLAENRARLTALVSDTDKLLKGGGDDQEAFVAEVLAWLDEADELLNDVIPPGAPDQIDLMGRLRVDLLNLQQEVLSSANSNYLQRIQQGLVDGTLAKKVVLDTERGFVPLRAYGMPSYQAEEWLSDMMVNMTRLEIPPFARSLSKFLGRYTGFFKAYAVSTPGFVVRNAMSNTFMLVAAGAEVKNMTEGLALYRAWRNAVRTGEEAAWLATQNPRIATAVAAMDASGYGRATEALRMFNPKRKWLVDNRYVNSFRKSNEWFEGSARFMLAYDSVVKGADLNEATARVKRYLFDYMTSTPADDVMRTIVPFWFWMSRNLPMQIVNQYENPRAYLLYNKTMTAIGKEEDENEVVPLWLRQAGGVKVADGLYLNPDLGFNKLNQQLQELADPMRLIAYVNPGIRVPLEAVFAQRKLYKDIPFSDKAKPTPGGPLSPVVAALATMLNQDKEMPDGGRGVTDRFDYAISNLVPPIAQISRLAPQDDYNKERRRSNWASYFGVPLREVTDSMIESELRRRKREGQ